MPKVRNEQIGECACPTRGCSVMMKVYRFRGTDDDSRRRFAGKLYGVCEDCGKIGADAGQKMQEYILDNGDIWDDKLKAEKNAPPPKKAPLPPPVTAPLSEDGPEPKPPAPSPKRPDLWDM